MRALEQSSGALGILGKRKLGSLAGEPEVHGKVAKTRKRAAEKAALATLQQQQAATPPGSGTAGQVGQMAQTGQGSVTTAPVAVVTAPAATGTSPVVSAPSAVPVVTNGVNGIANGAGH